MCSHVNNAHNAVNVSRANKSFTNSLIYTFRKRLSAYVAEYTISHPEVKDKTSYLNSTYRLDKIALNDFRRMIENMSVTYIVHNNVCNVDIVDTEHSANNESSNAIRSTTDFSALVMQELHETRILANPFSDAELFEILLSFLYPRVLMPYTSYSIMNNEMLHHCEIKNFAELLWLDVLAKNCDRSEFLAALRDFNNADYILVKDSRFQVSRSSNRIAINRGREDVTFCLCVDYLLNRDVPMNLSLSIAEVDYDEVKRYPTWRSPITEFVREQLDNKPSTGEKE